MIATTFLRTLVPTLVVATAAAAAGADEPQDLKYKWVEGDVIRQRMTNESHITMTGGPMAQMVMTQKQVTVSRMTVKSVDGAGVGTLQVVYEAVFQESNNPMMGRSSYDSTRPEQAATDPTSATLSQMLNEPFVMVITPDGAVREVTEFDKILAKMDTALRAIPGGERMAPEMRKALGPEGVQRMWEASTAVVPPRAVAVGDTWERTLVVPVPMIGSLTATRTFTLKGVETKDDARLARIDSTVATTLQPLTDEEKAANPMIAMMTPTLKASEGTGETWFDIERGQVHRQVIKQKMPLDMVMNADAQRMTMGQVVETTQTVERIGKDDPPFPPAK